MDDYFKLFKVCEYEQPGFWKSLFNYQGEKVCHYNYLIEMIEPYLGYLASILKILLLVLVIRLCSNFSVKFFNSIFIWLKKKKEIIKNKRSKINYEENESQNVLEIDSTKSVKTQQKFSCAVENSSDEMAEEILDQLNDYLDNLKEIPNYSKSSTY